MQSVYPTKCQSPYRQSQDTYWNLGVEFDSWGLRLFLPPTFSVPKKDPGQVSLLY